jgi:hypothetical protein
MGRGLCRQASGHVCLCRLRARFWPALAGARPLRYQAALLCANPRQALALCLFLPALLTGRRCRYVHRPDGARLLHDVPRRGAAAARCSTACASCRRRRSRSSNRPTAQATGLLEVRYPERSRNRCGARRRLARPRAGRLRTAVKRRMVADVPVGVLLSGGVDSSLIVGLLAEDGAGGPEDLLHRL